MKKTMRKIMIVLAAALMVMMMAVPSFAVSYPLQATVYFYSPAVTVTQYGGTTVNVPYWNTGAMVTYQNGFTTNFTTAFPTPAGVNHQYEDVQPTVMDAIFDTYYQINGNSSSGMNIGWDGSNTPNGAYVDKIHNTNEITEVLQSNYWKGYSWHIYLNAMTNTWDSSTRSGLIPQYASNVTLESGDVVYVIFAESSMTW